MSDFLTTEEAGAKLGVSARRVQALIKAGRLPAKMIGHGRLYLIARADLELVRIRKPGRPKGKKKTLASKKRKGAG